MKAETAQRKPDQVRTPGHPAEQQEAARRAWCNLATYALSLHSPQSAAAAFPGLPDRPDVARFQARCRASRSAPGLKSGLNGVAWELDGAEPAAGFRLEGMAGPEAGGAGAGVVGAGAATAGRLRDTELILGNNTFP